jgi:hypothetical protein
MHWIHFLTQWMRAHLAEISFSLTAMLLVVGGPYLNRAVMRFARSFHWVLRYALFVMLSTVGYGFITNFTLRGVQGFMFHLGGWQLPGFVLGAHLVLAWLLKRDKAL